MDDSIAHLVLLLQVVTTLFMVGVIWFVQVVHYPLMAHVGRAEAVAYEKSHTRRTGWVVGPPMLIELGTGFFTPVDPTDGCPIHSCSRGRGPPRGGLHLDSVRTGSLSQSLIDGIRFGRTPAFGFHQLGAHGRLEHARFAGVMDGFDVFI